MNYPEQKEEDWGEGVAGSTFRGTRKREYGKFRASFAEASALGCSLYIVIFLFNEQLKEFSSISLVPVYWYSIY